MEPKGSKFPMFEAAGPKNHTRNGFCLLEPETLNIGYLDPLGVEIASWALA